MVSGPKRRPADARILSVVYRRYSRHLSLWLWHHIPDRQLVDDFVQETFTRILGRGALCEVSSWRAYVFKTLRNVVAKAGMDTLREREILTQDSAEHDAVDMSQTEAADVELTFRAAADRLPPLWRQAILLTEQGLSDEEIATQLGKRVGAVRQYKLKARRRLQDELRL
jgi:RNA polymerase sigma factor (sigma-70 family)